MDRKIISFKKLVFHFLKQEYVRSGEAEHLLESVLHGERNPKLRYAWACKMTFPTDKLYNHKTHK